VQSLFIKSLVEFTKSNSLVIIEVVLVFVVIRVLIWLLVREFKIWYWKIDKIVNLLEKIETGVDFMATNIDQNNQEKETAKVRKSKELV